MHTPFHDPASVAGKAPPVGEATDLLIVGAGPAGIAAALEAAGRGIGVTLVDENPVPLETMGEDVPLHFGGRMGATAGNANAMLEAMLEARPELGDALEAGVDVRLGTAVWGLFPHGPARAWMDTHAAGLADASHAWLMSFKQVIVASGRRDMGLAFDGWQRPGVMGASAAWRLAVLYGALDARRAVLVGSDTDALNVAVELMARGVRIVAVIEQSEAILGDPALASQLEAGGARLLVRHAVRHAHGDAYGVTSVEAASLDTGASTAFECDTVLLGIAALPAIELPEAAGCATTFDAARSGHVVIVDAIQRTSLPFIHAAGDCAGVWASKSRDEDVAREEGRRAARAALEALGASRDETAATKPIEPDTPAYDIAQARVAWVQASVIGAAGEPFVCQCEEVTAREILDVRPPRYLDWHPADAAHDTRGVAGLAQSGPPNPDAVKRLTRACMGPCQGRRCREQVAALLAIGSGCALPQIPLATFRAPVRPLALRQLAEVAEASSTAAHWDSWFGMASQWVPFWRVEPLYRAGTRQVGEAVASE
ncbi:FAD-dependent oxidoreductase [Caballeronia sp. LZ043]|uniref:FAD/NAD(P)-dependent oxidoreductase n=1 Tax=Caballeronia sp. LZ043 TaxID=3038569 RepID=UPI0028621749|nr:FAD-dependent oxidoreductase [Caballeronia sp. LZ043]MDR5825273.1 FAD-dependent oxidoreductase [Caballeronia sp. LZ043]